jgi:hypothetical protein
MWHDSSMPKRTRIHHDDAQNALRVVEQAIDGCLKLLFFVGVFITSLEHDRSTLPWFAQDPAEVVIVTS